MNTPLPPPSMNLPKPDFAYDAVVVKGGEETSCKVVYISAISKSEFHNVKCTDGLTYRAKRLGHLDHEPRFRIEVKD